MTPTFPPQDFPPAHRILSWANTKHKFIELPDETLGVYNAYDTHFTAQLYKPLRDQLDKLEVLEDYERWIVPLTSAVVRMQCRGMLVDKEAMHEYRLRINRELRETDGKILSHDNAGPLREPTATFTNSIGSTKKLRAFLFDPVPEGLGLKPTRKTDKGQWSVDLETLFQLHKRLRKKDEHAREVLGALYHRSKLNKTRTNYCFTKPDWDGRVRADVKMASAKTGRFAYADPPLQQWPKDARHVFISKPGYVLLSRDYSQLEARILAYLAGDQVSIRAFETNVDVHSQNACDLFGWDYGDWDGLRDNDRKITRDYSKMFLYRIGYGGSAAGIAEDVECPCSVCTRPGESLQITKEEAVEAEKRWYKVHSAVPKYHRRLFDQVRTHHYFDYPLGGRRYFMSPWGTPGLETELKNAPMQGTAAKRMAIAQVELDRDYDAPIVLQMHDEFLLEVPENELDYWVRVTKEVMERPLEDAGELTGVVLPTDCEVGRDWGHLEEV